MTLTRKLERMREKYRMEQATSKALREALEEVTLRGRSSSLTPLFISGLHQALESKNSDTIEQMRRDYKNLEKMMESCQSSKAVIESTLKSLRQELNAAVDRIKLEGNFGACRHLIWNFLACVESHHHEFVCSGGSTCTESRTSKRH